MAEGRHRLAGLLLILGLVVTACGGGTDSPISGLSTSDDDGYHGAALTDPYVVPDVSLTDTAGEPYSTTADTTHRLTLVFFGYTKCPDICQVVMSTLASALTRLDTSDRKEVQVLFVTTDPARDTASVLKSYVSRFDPDFEGLTGPLAKIEELGKPLKVFIAKGRKLPSGGYEVDHSTQVLAVTDDRVPLVWTGNTSPAQIAEDIHKLLLK